MVDAKVSKFAAVMLSKDLRNDVIDAVVKASKGKLTADDVNFTDIVKMAVIRKYNLDVTKYKSAPRGKSRKYATMKEISDMIANGNLEAARQAMLVNVKREENAAIAAKARAAKKPSVVKVSKTNAA